MLFFYPAYSRHHTSLSRFPDKLKSRYRNSVFIVRRTGRCWFTRRSVLGLLRRMTVSFFLSFVMTIEVMLR